MNRQRTAEAKVGYGGKNREANMELLRIIAMFMIISLHYFSKGNIIGNFSATMGFNESLAWVLETLSIVSVNVFVLISGYYLVESGFRMKRLIVLVGQVLFYSLLIPPVLVLLGVLPVENITIYHILNYLFPLQTELYWFATAYILLYILMPVLAAGVRKLKKSQLQIVIVLALIAFSVSKSILPIKLPMDKAGYDITWFICLFLVAAYIRLFGLPVLHKGKRGLWLYLGGSVLTLGLAMSLSILSAKMGVLTELANGAYHYNHFFVFLSSVGLFCFFLGVRIPAGKISQLICKIAPFTFGVYLLHEHVEVRFLWPVWLNVESIGQTPYFLLHLAGSILLIFVMGILVDWLRSLLFLCIGKIFANTGCGKWLNKIDTIMRGV